MQSEPGTQAASADGPRGASAIVQAVLAALTAGRLPPGSRLREDRLAEHFGVSRTIVREALRELSFLGFVETLPRRGASVVQPTSRDADELYEARIAVETALVAELARHCTANDIRSLREHLARQRQARSLGSQEFARMLGDFHLVLARLAGNSVMLHMLEQLVARTSLLSALYGSTEESCALDHHDSLIAHLASGNGPQAAAEMRRHLLDNRARLSFPPTPPAARRGFDLSTALAPVPQTGARATAS